MVNLSGHLQCLSYSRRTILSQQDQNPKIDILQPLIAYRRLLNRVIHEFQCGLQAILVLADEGFFEI